MAVPTDTYEMLQYYMIRSESAASALSLTKE
jgi:hypothetical protein